MQLIYEGVCQCIEIGNGSGPVLEILTLFNEWQYSIQDSAVSDSHFVHDHNNDSIVCATLLRDIAKIL